MKITDEQLNKYLEIRTELGEENFGYLGFVFDNIILKKKEELTKDVKMEITDFSKFREYAKKQPYRINDRAIN
ncbi:Uncharacterised protein [Streptococcus dysgalactiae subsp. dysgalactiae]|uniref:Uncharacterized protein n=2 Tax=Streptococcus TaxID=1301 RepID=A0A380JXU5_STRDY|nr:MULTISPECIES: hypothetical protein [Streptococcus]QBX23933.1 hypothetical protein Javan166_0062 [Streptococcus phage Javan166]KKC23198.1 hypothetical protein WH79_02965 [Streptococcus dysgalactiae subsp. equisimilis]MCY7220378.1 hypothetical protein [Streptococcus dysgalactiae]SQE85283.1 Uncharacterised protein [Streptococcus dysgalactiae subsp. equisimilis]SUN50807.1 Uncharacterised protein [Streptococcus dysgalactiae subsp. dysgalactiae]